MHLFSISSHPFNHYSYDQPKKKIIESVNPVNASQPVRHPRRKKLTAKITFTSFLLGYIRGTRCNDNARWRKTIPKAFPSINHAATL